MSVLMQRLGSLMLNMLLNSNVGTMTFRAVLQHEEDVIPEPLLLRQVLLTSGQVSEI